MAFAPSCLSRRRTSQRQRRLRIPEAVDLQPHALHQGQVQAAQRGIAVVALVTLEFGVGVAAVVTSLPIGLAVAHNWLAALLLLGLTGLIALNRSNP